MRHQTPIGAEHQIIRSQANANKQVVASLRRRRAASECRCASGAIMIRLCRRACSYPYRHPGLIFRRRHLRQCVVVTKTGSIGNTTGRRIIAPVPAPSTRFQPIARGTSRRSMRAGQHFPACGFPAPSSKAADVDPLYLCGYTSAACYGVIAPARQHRRAAGDILITISHCCQRQPLLCWKAS